ncbi:hypothetical protein [Sediminimonas sp.]|uniref:hypothetical protein n=1 Tax=Sediminimonas sp. TaxID=2823379 RepID=UPI0025EDEAFD|nr:hypothetical protein [Sediminimonas sp.]
MSSIELIGFLAEITLRALSVGFVFAACWQNVRGRSDLAQTSLLWAILFGVWVQS